MEFNKVELSEEEREILNKAEKIARDKERKRWGEYERWREICKYEENRR